jgi:hypothetical protein
MLKRHATRIVDKIRPIFLVIALHIAVFRFRGQITQISSRTKGILAAYSGSLLLKVANMMAINQRGRGITPSHVAFLIHLGVLWHGTSSCNT